MNNWSVVEYDNGVTSTFFVVDNGKPATEQPAILAAFDCREHAEDYITLHNAAVGIGALAIIGLTALIGVTLL